jgi:hypothetical protein
LHEYWTNTLFKDQGGESLLTLAATLQVCKQFPYPLQMLLIADHQYLSSDGSDVLGMYGLRPDPQPFPSPSFPAARNGSRRGQPVHGWECFRYEAMACFGLDRVLLPLFLLLVFLLLKPIASALPSAFHLPLPSRADLLVSILPLAISLLPSCCYVVVRMVSRSPWYRYRECVLSPCPIAVLPLQAIANRLTHRFIFSSVMYAGRFPRVPSSR